MRFVDRHEFLRSSMVQGDPRRADANLRQVCRVVGEAWMCLACDGDGVVLSSERREPVKCSRCGGEGLEPSL